MESTTGKDMLNHPPSSISFMNSSAATSGENLPELETQEDDPLLPSPHQSETETPAPAPRVTEEGVEMTALPSARITASNLAHQISEEHLGPILIAKQEPPAVTPPVVQVTSPVASIEDSQPPAQSSSSSSVGNRDDEHDVEHNDRPQPPQLPQPPHKADRGPYMYAFFALSFVVSSVIYSWAMSLTSGILANMVPASESRSVAILIILTTLAGMLLTELCAVTLEVISWTRVQSSRGISIASFLSISPTTPLEGLFRLLGWRTGRANHCLWVVIR